MAKISKEKKDAAAPVPTVTAKKNTDKKAVEKSKKQGKKVASAPVPVAAPVKVRVIHLPVPIHCYAASSSSLYYSHYLVVSASSPRDDGPRVYTSLRA